MMGFDFIIGLVFVILIVRIPYQITLVRSSIHPDNIPLLISFAHVHLKLVSLFAHHVGTGDNPKILRNWLLYLRYVSTLP